MQCRFTWNREANNWVFMGPIFLDITRFKSILFGITRFNWVLYAAKDLNRLISPMTVVAKNASYIFLIVGR